MYFVVCFVMWLCSQRALALEMLAALNRGAAIVAEASVVVLVAVFVNAELLLY